MSAGAAHFEALALLHAMAFARRARTWSSAEIAALAKAPGAVLVVEGAPPEGFALARVTADEAEVLTIAVDPSRQRRGAGARLLARAEAAARDAGATAMLLEVDDNNAPALALYRSAGFAVVGARRDYTRVGVDALVMRKELVIA